MDINKHLLASEQLSECELRESSCNKSNSIWVSIFFDGTGNNRKNDKLTGKLSNVAKLFDSHKDNTLFGFHKIYERGVGTQNKDPDIYEQCRDSLLLGGGLGLGGMGRVEDAISQLTNLLKDKPHAKIKNIAVFGFSRGAALARHFVNVLVKEGIKSSKKSSQPFEVEKDFNIKFVGLFDTVGSFGIGGNNVDLGFDFDIPDEVEQVAHYIAGHERRSKFDLQSIRSESYSPVTGKLKEVIYPGMHSNVGGGYAPTEQGRAHELSRIPLNDMFNEAIKAGVPLMSKAELKLTAPDTYPLFEVSNILQNYYDDYCRHTPSRSNLYQSIACHEAIYFKWLKQQITQGGFVNAVANLQAIKDEKMEALTPLSEKELKLRKDLRAELKKIQKYAPRKQTGGMLRSQMFNDPDYNSVFKALSSEKEELEAIENRISSLQGAYEQLDENYRSIKWRYQVSRGIRPGFEPPNSVFYHSSPKERREDKRIKPLTTEENEFLLWMDDPIPLPLPVKQFFDQYIHDSVAHTPDPAGDSYFQPRAIFFQGDDRWFSEGRV